MASSMRIKNTLQEYLNCPICLEPLKDAKIMVCGHSFCKTCIGKVIRGAREHQVDNGDHVGMEYTFECPCCRREQSLKQRSADELGSNFMANDIAAVLSDGDRLLRTSVYDTCAKHDSNEKRYFCLRCEVPICSDCGMTEHFGHDDHPSTMAEMEASYKRKLARLLDETRSKTTHHSIHGAKLKLIKEEGCSTIDKVAEAVDEAFDEWYMELSKARNSLCESIQDIRDAFCRQQDESILAHQAALDEVNKASEEVSKSLKRSRPVDLIQSYGGWKKKLKSAWDVGCPPLQALEHAKQELQKIKELSFRRNPMKGELCVGELTQPIEVAISKTAKGDKNKVKGSGRNAVNSAGPSNSV